MEIGPEGEQQRGSKAWVGPIFPEGGEEWFGSLQPGLQVASFRMSLISRIRNRVFREAAEDMWIVLTVGQGWRGRQEEV